jgi:uncharacterized ferritin-like protein (DUF455 family)
VSAPDLPPLTPGLYGDEPAREPRFTVVERWAQCHNTPGDHPDHRLEFLHRQMNEEANVLENAASSLVDFPDADWSIRMWLARQCADEARHVLKYKQLFESRGGRLGQFPIMNFQYRILRRIDSLEGRLMVQNRTFEADGLDAAVFAVRQAEEEGDMESAAMYDAQQADEIIHVGFANAWIRRRIKEDPRIVLQVARALSQGARAFLEIAAGGGTDVSAYGVAHAERRLAGFDEGEIAVAHELAEARRTAARARRAAAPGAATGS